MIRSQFIIEGAELNYIQKHGSTHTHMYEEPKVTLHFYSLHSIQHHSPESGWQQMGKDCSLTLGSLYDSQMLLFALKETTLKECRRKPAFFPMDKQMNQVLTSVLQEAAARCCTTV